MRSRVIANGKLYFQKTLLLEEDILNYTGLTIKQKV